MHDACKVFNLLLNIPLKFPRMQLYYLSKFTKDKIIEYQKLAAIFLLVNTKSA